MQPIRPSVGFSSFNLGGALGIAVIVDRRRRALRRRARRPRQAGLDCLALVLLRGEGETEDAAIEAARAITPCPPARASALPALEIESVGVD
jgi:hypothetical protein